MGTVSAWKTHTLRDLQGTEGCSEHYHREPKHHPRVPERLRPEATRRPEQLWRDSGSTARPSESLRRRAASPPETCSSLQGRARLSAQPREPCAVILRGPKRPRLRFGRAHRHSARKGTETRQSRMVTN